MKFLKEWENDIYKKGFEAGVNAQKLSDHEAQNHRLEDMLRRGKAIGYDNGFMEGYEKGYKVGYSEGEVNAKAEIGEIDLALNPELFDELEALDEEVQETETEEIQPDGEADSRDVQPAS